MAQRQGDVAQVARNPGHTRGMWASSGHVSASGRVPTLARLVIAHLLALVRYPRHVVPTHARLTCTLVLGAAAVCSY